MIVVHAYLFARPDTRSEFAAGLRALAESTRADDSGCLEYAFWSDVEDPDRFVCVERWADMDSLRAHLAAPHHAAGSAVLDELRAQPAEVSVFAAEPIEL